MVRGLGISHKSLFVPGVSEGTYAIRFEHADYLSKDFSISVGAALPTTFTEAMTGKTYDIGLEFPSTTFLTNASIVEGDPLALNTFKLRNNGNLSIYGWYILSCYSIDLGVEGFLGPIAPGATVDVSIPNQSITSVVGTHAISLVAGPSTTDGWIGALASTDDRTEQLTIVGWTTDITFVATAPGIADLHGVEVFIDGTSMGTT